MYIVQGNTSAHIACANSMQLFLDDFIISSCLAETELDNDAPSASPRSHLNPEAILQPVS